MKVDRFRPEHLKHLMLQPAQKGIETIVLRPEYAAALSLAGEAITISDGKPLACIGVQKIHEYRAEAWALMDGNCGRIMRPITRLVRGWLDQTEYPRIEATVEDGFEQGHRWCRILGFTLEGPVRKGYMPTGRDAYTYVKLRA